MYDIYNEEIRYRTPLYTPDPIIYGRGYKSRKIYSGYKNLEYRKIIEKTGSEKYRFTKKGEVWLRGSLLRYARDLNIKWDKKWRLVIFDIPQEFHNERNRFRQKLKALGFYKVQKSVFAFPYPCEDELARICGQLNISDYINVIRAADLGLDNVEAMKFFKL